MTYTCTSFGFLFAFFFAFTLTHLLGQFYYGVTKCHCKKFCCAFSLRFLRIFVHILNPIEPNTLIWVSMKRPSPPTELEHRWWQFCSKVMTSEVEQRPMLVTSTYDRYRGQWVNDYRFKGNSESFFFPRESQCFPQLHLGKHWDKIYCSPKDQSLIDLLLYTKTKQKQILKNKLRSQWQHQATFNCSFWSHATEVNLLWVTMNCFPFDIIIFAVTCLFMGCGSKQFHC